jgi:hypothetical protein
MKCSRRIIMALITLLGVAGMARPLRAQEGPYFVTYDQHMEEPGNLELSAFSTVGLPSSGERTFVAPYLELEYGTTAWWTSELYLDGQSTAGDSTIFTGWRLENRFHVLRREHFVNPVLYFEYENLNEADKIRKEIVGNAPSVGESNSELRRERAHELEAKLILSSNVHDWNLSENFIVEKNLSASEGFEFGYAIGASHPLASLASGEKCRFCRENFVAGLEAYGGLGSTLGFGVHDTAHYVAPAISWQLSDNSALHFSPSFGVTSGSNPVLFRFGYSYEIQGFGSKVAAFFRGKH